MPLQLLPIPLAPLLQPQIVVSRPSSQREVFSGTNVLNRQRDISAIIEHSLGTIIEYPQSSTSMKTTMRISFK